MERNQLFFKWRQQGKQLVSLCCAILRVFHCSNRAVSRIFPALSLKKNPSPVAESGNFAESAQKESGKTHSDDQDLLTEHSKLVKVGLSKSDFDDSGSLCWHNGRALLHKQKHFCPQAIYSRLVTYSLRHSAASALASSLRDLALTVLLS